MTPAWFHDLEQRANQLSGLSTTSSTKYDELKAWLTSELTAEPAVCFVSDEAKQWTPRVGQALMGFPRLLVLLVRTESAQKIAKRLSDIHRYVTGLHATIVLVGDEGSWRVDLIAGTAGRSLYETLAGARPQAVEPVESFGEVSEAAEVPQESVDIPRFSTLEPSEQAELIWECLVGLGGLDVDEAIRTAGSVLRVDGLLEFERLRRDGRTYAAIENAISWATRRGILFDRPTRTSVRAILPNPDDFTRDRWRECVLKVAAESGPLIDRDQLVRATAEHAVSVYGLDMQRLRGGGRIDTGIRSAVNSLIRRGLLEREGPHQLRVPEHHPAPAEAANGEGRAPSSAGHSQAMEPDSRVVSADETSAQRLRAMVGQIPGQAEAVFLQLLEVGLKTPAELHAQVASHLKEFEDAFAVHAFLDLSGAEQLAADSRRLLELWPTLTEPQRHVAQAAILYYVASDEADDDFRIGGLWTDKQVMEAVNRALLPEAS